MRAGAGGRKYTVEYSQRTRRVGDDMWCISYDILEEAQGWARQCVKRGGWARIWGPNGAEEV
jgi:hypothetical protein